jgi:hypothetical protein
MMDKTQCAECERLARKADELAAQNLAMREAMKDAENLLVCCLQALGGQLTVIGAPVPTITIKGALALPDLAADILRKRDAETLRNAAAKIDEPIYPDEPKSRLDFHRGWNAKCADILRLAAELEVGK